MGSLLALTYIDHDSEQPDWQEVGWVSCIRWDAEKGSSRKPKTRTCKYLALNRLRAGAYP
jgi:hypothetical protein